MIRDVQKLFDETIFPELKEYILSNSEYAPSIYDNEPETKTFPLIIAQQHEMEGNYTTLKYTDYVYPFTMFINVYALQKGNISNITICNELCDIIERFFYERYRMTVKTRRNVENIDTTVHRSFITVSCKIDTKFKDKLVIYPK